MANNHSVAGWYTEWFKAWPKSAGPKPTNDQLEIAHAFGKPGKQSLALAMAMRECGVTDKQVCEVMQKSQNNHRNGLVAGKKFARIPMSKVNEGRLTVYRIELTAQGQKAVDNRKQADLVETKLAQGEGAELTAKALAKASKAAKRVSKAKGAPKVKKAPEVPAVETPTSEAVMPPELTVTPVQPENPADE